MREKGNNVKLNVCFSISSEWLLIHRVMINDDDDDYDDDDDVFISASECSIMKCKAGTDGAA